MGQTLKFGCGGLVALFILLAIISALSGGSKSTATHAPTPVPTSTAINLAAAESPSVQSTATPIPATATPAVFVVANTGGEGVYIRRSTEPADKIKAWPDNTEMIVIGESKIVDSVTWINVKDPDGNEGWVLAEYLIQSLEQPVPAARVVTSEPMGCFTPPKNFTQELANGLTVTGRGGLKGAQAIKISLSGNDSSTWYLVGAIITGPGMGNDVVGLWATTADLASATPTAGMLFSANSIAKGFSEWPQPDAIWGRFTSLNPDVQTIVKCVKSTVGR